MKILVFGGSGFVGGYLFNELKLYNHEVVLTDFVDKSNKNVKIIDITKKDEVYTLINNVKPDCIVNLASISSVSKSWSIPQTTIAVNLIGTINILESVKEIGLKCKILLIGSSEEYVPSNEKMNEESPLYFSSPYSISKIAQEKFANIYIEKYGMNIIMTRTFNHTGIGQSNDFVIPSFISQVINAEDNGIIKVGNLDIFRDIGNVKDMVTSYRILLENNNKNHIYNIGNGNSYSLKSILEYIVKLSNKKIIITVDNSRFRPIDNYKTWCDNSRFVEEYNWKPKYDLFNTIKEMYFYNNN